MCCSVGTALGLVVGFGVVVVGSLLLLYLVGVWSVVYLVVCVVGGVRSVVCSVGGSVAGRLVAGLWFDSVGGRSVGLWFVGSVGRLFGRSAIRSSIRSVVRFGVRPGVRSFVRSGVR